MARLPSRLLLCALLGVFVLAGQPGVAQSALANPGGGHRRRGRVFFADRPATEWGEEDLRVRGGAPTRHYRRILDALPDAGHTKVRRLAGGQIRSRRWRSKSAELSSSEVPHKHFPKTTATKNSDTTTPLVLVHPSDAATLLNALKQWTVASGSASCTGSPSLPTGWNASIPCAIGWDGVWCDESGRVVGISLSEREICGSLPSSLPNLSALTSLDLSFNQLSGPLPSSLGSFGMNSDIDLSYNQLSGSLPSSIGKLSGTIYLYNNGLSGSLPSSIGNISGLLNARYNRLSGSLPSSLGNLTGYITVSNNEIKGTLPSTLGNLEGTLYVRRSQLTGTLPTSLGKLTGSLVLSYNMLTGPLPSSLANLKGELGLGANLITGSLPFNISKVPGFVDLTDNYLSGVCPSEVGSLSFNCFRNCPPEINMYGPDVCAVACGSDQPTGPCLNRGACLVQNGASNPPASCACNPGFISPPSNPATCVPPTPPPPPGFVTKLCVGAVTNAKQCKCPAWAQCQRKSFCNNRFVCRCTGIKRRPVTDPKTGVLLACK